jgi:hypothetical protein
MELYTLAGLLKIRDCKKTIRKILSNALLIAADA